MGAGDAGCAKLRNVLQRDRVDALGLASVPASLAEAAEAEVRLAARRVERERIHVAADREVILTDLLVRLREPDEIERTGSLGRSRARRDRDREGETDEVAHRAGHARDCSALRGIVPTVPSSVLARVVSSNDVASPFSPSSLSALRAAFIHVELVELDGSDRVLGALVLGDVVTLAIDDRPDGLLSLVVRRTEFRRVTIAAPPTVLDRVPPEVVPLLAGSTGGPIGYRERPVRRGECVLLRAAIEQQDGRFVVRDDREPVQLDEVLGDPFERSRAT